MVSAIAALLDKAVAGERLTFDEGVRLLESHDLAAIGRAADAVTRRLHPENYRTYNIDRNVNYTNVCSAVCDFCAFYRGPKDPEGYVLYTYAAFQAWAQAAAKAGTTDPQKVAAALRSGTWDTVLGPITYDKKGDITSGGWAVYRWDKDGNYDEIYSEAGRS